MKAALLAFLLLGFTQFATAEDSVTCATGLSVVLTDASTINVTRLLSHQKLRAIHVIQTGDLNIVRVENDKTVLRNARLLKVSVLIDNGTSVRSLMNFDWSKFEDGGTVPAEMFDLYPNGRLERLSTIECDAAQS